MNPVIIELSTSFFIVNKTPFPLLTLDKDEFINSFNEKYNFETPLTGNYPAFVIFKDGKIDSILQGTDNAPVTLSKVESYLELNNIKEGE